MAWRVGQSHLVHTPAPFPETRTALSCVQPVLTSASPRCCL